MVPQAVAIVAPLLLACAAAASAQTPELPPGATGKVLDLVFKVEDFGAKTEAISIKETETEVRIELAADVLFEFDQATLLPKAQDTLAKAAAFMHERAVTSARIEGHTDSKGDDTYNLKLSQLRADAVRRWFAAYGLGKVKFSTVGLGETRPVAPNAGPNGADDPEGRSKNRRVEIVIARGR